MGAPKALLLHSENSAVGKYRIWQPAKHLEKLGWEVRRIPDEVRRIPIDRGYDGNDPELLESLKEIGSWEDLIDGVDIIVMQRPDQPETLALAMALREQANCSLVFEVDDNIYDVAKSSTSYQYWYEGSPLRKIAEMFMENCDAITVSTPALVDVYKHLNPNIHVLPNYQDHEEWAGITPVPGEDGKIVIGWAGSSTHYDDLHMIRRPLKKLLRNHKNVAFKCVGMRPDFLEGVDRVEVSTAWAPVREWPKALAKLGFDIGIAPVVHRPFNLAKSNIKWQEYSMLGIPTVASNLGEYKAIDHGKTGFLASSEDEWYFYLEQLVKDTELRKQVGEQAKAAMSEFDSQKRAIEWDKTYRAIIAKYKAS